METIYVIGSAALLSLLSLSPAFAQDNASSASSDPSSSMSSEPSTQPPTENYGALISSLQAGTSADLSVIGEKTTVNFVTVSSIKANGNTNALDNALKKNATTVAKLRTDVAANVVLSAKITASHYTADQVVAVITEADGSVTVVIDDRS